MGHGGDQRHHQHPARGVGSGARDVLAAGEKGTILWFNGLAWAAETSGTTSSFRTLWGSGVDDVYAPGEFGTLAHTKRATLPNVWSSVTHGVGTETFLGSWGTSSKDVFVVGTSGMIARFDGAKWTKMTSGVTDHLVGV